MSLAKITKEQLEEFTRTQAQKREIDRQSRALDDRLRTLRKHFDATMRAAGKTTARRLGYFLTYEEGPARVAWKDAFIERLGPDAAAQLQQAAVPTLRLTVQQAASLEAALPAPGRPSAA